MSSDRTPDVRPKAASLGDRITNFVVPLVILVNGRRHQVTLNTPEAINDLKWARIRVGTGPPRTSRPISRL